MSGPDHAALQRDMGRVEGKQDEMGARLDRLEKIMVEGLNEIRKDIAELKLAESRRKGALAVIVALGGAVGAAFWAVIEHFWK